ncbi:MAG: DUF3516 domain-containing protein [Phycisphaerae bacterium]|nr:DUF3516 domain-containing protein [Phycisphaerae bacterium]
MVPIVIPAPPLLQHRPDSAEASDCLVAFITHCEAAKIEPYPAQIAAFEAIFEHRSVVLATPTGSGKSLVALAAHFAAYWRGHAGLDPSIPEHLRRSVYTAPTKALVNEKFFNLCDAFGAANVGLMTGDATVNAAAPIMCCTAEILESIALREGTRAPFGWVVMDEFHYFSDPERGSAWLVPLLEMTDARFLLMSATLHDLEPDALCADLRRRTGADAVAVTSKDRPVPLEYRYKEDRLLMETIEEVLRDGLVPVYVVSFRRRDAAELAPKLRSTGLNEKARERRALIHAELEQHRLDTPFGRTLKELLPHGLAVHHGGMLPKYRRLVERLATQGLISVISGTDTLGVGVNMPIRSVLFTQLSKGGGPAGMHTLKPGEFRQIAGRAGRKGHDTMGTVIVQPPEHEVNNIRKKRKTGVSGKKFYAESPPPGFKAWNEKTLERLRDAPLDRLVPRFAITGPVVLQILRRSGDGRAALERLIASVGAKEAEYREKADTILAAFEEAGLAKQLAQPDAQGCLYDLAAAQECMESFDRPLVPFVRFAMEQLDPADPNHDLDVLTIAESIVDDPQEVLNAQRRRLQDARRQELWMPGMSLDQTASMRDELDAITHPKPMAEELEVWFKHWDAKHPFIADREPSAKSVARDLLERGMSFSDYVSDHGLIHHEQSLYYYLSDVQKVIARAIAAPPASLATATPDPEEEAKATARREAIARLLEDLSALVETIDSSVAEEWSRHGLEPDAALLAAASASRAAAESRVTARASAARLDGLLRRMVRTQAFEWVRALERKDYARLASPGYTAGTASAQSEPYWAEYEAVLITADARGPEFFDFDLVTGRVRQWILDPQDDRQWFVEGAVDMDASRAEGRPVLRVVRLADQSRAMEADANANDAPDSPQ